MKTKLGWICAAAVCIVVLAACGGGKKNTSKATPGKTAALTSSAATVTSGTPSTPRATAPPEGTEVPFEGAKDPVEAPPQASGQALVTDVQLGKHTTYDRVTFQFSADGLPGYRVEYVPQSEATQCGSGQAVEVPLTTFLRIRLTPANAHDEQGASTISRTQLAPNLLQTCDFEAVVVWVLGLNDERDFRVVTLTDPPRIAVDVAHQ